MNKTTSSLNREQLLKLPYPKGQNLPDIQNLKLKREMSQEEKIQEDDNEYEEQGYIHQLK